MSRGIRSQRSGLSPRFRFNLSSICQGFPGPRGEKGDRSERGEKVRAREKGDGHKHVGRWRLELQVLIAAGPWGISLRSGEGVPQPGNCSHPTISFSCRGSEEFQAGKE